MKSVRYGITFGLEEATFGNKLKYVWNTALDYVRTVKFSIEMLFSGQAGIQDLSGPVGVVEQMSQTAAASETALDALMNMLNFGALIAVNLAVMNLLPIPALDGGRLIFILLEIVRGKPIDREKEGLIHTIGMVCLMILMVLLVFNDVRKLF